MDTTQLKSLLMEWQNCDSIFRKENLRKEIENLIVPILKRECRICEGFGVNSLWCDSDNYVSNSGYYTLEDFDCLRDYIRVLYQDSAHHEDYELVLGLFVDEISDFNEEKLKDKIKKKKIQDINNQISDLKIKLSKLEKQLFAAEKL